MTGLYIQTPDERVRLRDQGARNYARHWMAHNPYVNGTIFDDMELRHELIGYAMGGPETPIIKDFIKVTRDRCEHWAFGYSFTGMTLLQIGEWFDSLPERIKDYVGAGGHFIGVDHGDKRVRFHCERLMRERRSRAA